MNHHPILSPSDSGMIFEFSHFNYDAHAGIWKKENIIAHPFIKLNIFIEGSFSVFCDGTLHQPIYGDICFFPPMKMHYGQVKEPMHIQYYQLDIDRHVFTSIPEGTALLERLIRETNQKDSFLRPNPQEKERVIGLCREIEESIRNRAPYLAYAKIIELLSFLDLLYQNASHSTGIAYSLRTAQAIRYIEDHYAEPLPLSQMATHLGISVSFLSRIFKKELGITLHEYLNQYRILKSLEFLKQQSVTESGYLCGFCDTSHFISVFKQYMKTTPMQYKNLHCCHDE